MKTVKTFILSELLHRANREYKNEYFYCVKNKILVKYGKHIDYDVQFIEGKKCYSCGGTGVYYGWSQPQDCNRCFGGWYKLPTWNILSRVQFGKYIFHQPYKRVYKKPEIEKPLIEGYIEHTRAKYGALSVFILCLFYEKGYLKRWWKSVGMGWRTYWYYPSNWIYNLAHLVKNGTNSIPFSDQKRKMQNLIRKLKGAYVQPEYSTDSEDLPF